MSVSTASTRQLAINTIRTLSMDAVQQANSGHPGTPMALAPVAYTLWNDTLRYDPSRPAWPSRDRFVLSCGHASMLLYSMLHLAAVRKTDDQGQALDSPAVTLDDIRNFRQLHSPCAGHPEYGEAAGIETTTGPLGQGVANSVGMAIAAKWFQARYDRPDKALFGYNTYALCSDGDVMEGIGCEAASLAGHLKLSNLCWIYDDNRITIEGETKLAFSEQVGPRFEALGWQTVVVEDANDLTALQAALAKFEVTTDRPTLVIVRSIIGFGAPNKANTAGAHGSPLGEDEIRLAKSAYGWPEDAKFVVPDEVREDFAQGIGKRGGEMCDSWHEQFEAYCDAYPQEAAELKEIWSGKLPTGWDSEIPEFPTDAKGLATRASSGKVLNAVAARIPWLLGGSADLAPSNNTMLKADDAGHFSAENYGGRNFHFGVREHSMASICNGMSLSGLRPYCGTFFVFTDYLRPSLRLSSMMGQGVVYVMTHDSIGLGEDGPTHQPVEHLAACRAIPGLYVYRPADANEVAQSYRTLISRADRPAMLVLTRQGLPTLDRSEFGPAEGVQRGAYVLADSAGGEPQVLLMGSGSEVHLCLEAWRQLQADGISARVVSMPCWELFLEQEEAYRDEVLPPSVTARVAVEAGVRFGWDAFVGPTGAFVGMKGFGASAPFKTLYEHFGITPEGIVDAARAQVAAATK